MATEIAIDAVCMVRCLLPPPHARTPPPIACAWLHGDWEAAWLLAEPLVTAGASSSHTRLAGVALFRVCVRLRPLPLSTLEAAVLPASRTCDGRQYIGSALKLHFFRPLTGPNQLPEFAFASAIPLAHLCGDAPAPAGVQHHGVWNAVHRECIQFGRPHPDWLVSTVCVHPATLPASVAVAPACLRMRADRQHYERLMGLGEGISRALRAGFRHHHFDRRRGGSGADAGDDVKFEYPPTGLRDAYAVALIQDLPRLLRRTGSCYPPSLCCVAVARALAERGLDPAGARVLMVEAKAHAAAARALFAFLQSAIVCFSACVAEGYYRPDTLDGRLSDDQPFPCASRPPADLLQRAADRFPDARVKHLQALPGDNECVTDADDCEGSTQHACLCVAEAFRCVAADRAAAHSFARVRSALAQARPCLRSLSDAAVQALLDVAADIGDLLRGERPRVRLLVTDGAVRMGVLSNSAPSKPEGHCFALFTLRSDDCAEVDEGLAAAHVVETTLWTLSMEQDLSALPPPAMAAALPLWQLVAGAERPGALVRRHIVPDALQRQLYPYLSVGDGHMFFTLEPQHHLQPPHFTTSPAVLQGRPAALLFADRQRHSTERVLALLRRQPDASLALAIRTEDVLAAMDPAEPAWLGFPKLPDAARWRTEHTAVCAMYDALAQELRPPPEPEAALVARMERHWGELKDCDFTQRKGGAPAFAFAYARKDPARGRKLLRDIRSLMTRHHPHVPFELRSMDFMHSTLVLMEFGTHTLYGGGA